MQWCFGTLREDPHQDQPPSLRVGLADTIALVGVLAVISVQNTTARQTHNEANALEAVDNKIAFTIAHTCQLIACHLGRKTHVASPADRPNN